MATVRIQAHLGDIEISFDLFGCQGAGGDDRIRTGDPLLAKQVLSLLSYIPWPGWHSPTEGLLLPLDGSCLLSSRTPSP